MNNVEKYLSFFKYAKKILNDQNSNVITHSIELLNFYKFHEDYLVDKKNILNKNIFNLLLYLIIKIFFDFIKWLFKYFKYYDLTSKDYSSDEHNVIIVSHFFGNKEEKYIPSKDWIFNKLNSYLLRNSHKVKFILFNYSSIPEKKIIGNCIVIKKILPISDELKILLLQLRELKNIFSKFYLKKKIGFLIFLQIVNSIFLPETRNNIRIYLQFKKILQLNKTRYLISTFEGYPWEKMLFYNSKRSNPNCKVIGYQHTFVPKNTCWLNNSSKLLLPDYIFTSGIFNKKKINKINNFYKKKIFNIGSNRYFEIKKKNFNKNKNFLMLPEGTIFETTLFIELAKNLAEKFTYLNFILRFHPLINIKKIIRKNFNKKNFLSDNLIVSNKNFSEDVKRCDVAIYRGSTSIVSAIINKILPLYYDPNKSHFNIDPIFDTKIKKIYFKDEEEFSKVLNILSKFKRKYITHNMIEAKKFYSSFENKLAENFFKRFNFKKI